jgi:hypothetical protein
MLMPTPPARRLVCPGVWIASGGLVVAGAVLGLLIHPAWAFLAVLGALALIFIPDPTEAEGERSC